MPNSKPPTGKVTLQQLYPGKSVSWYEEAEEIFDRYLEVILRIYEWRTDEAATQNVNRSQR